MSVNEITTRRSRQINMLDEVVGRCNGCSKRVLERQFMLCSNCVELLEVQQDACESVDDHDRMRYIERNLPRFLDQLENILESVEWQLSSGQRDRIDDWLAKLRNEVAWW